MNRYDICCIGHITLDKVITPVQTAFMPGGTAYYFSHAITAFCKKYLLVTAVADSELSSVVELQERGIAVKRFNSQHTVFFENRYGKNVDERWQRVLQQADAFSVEALEELNAAIFHVGPLLANDIAMEAIIRLSAKGKVSLDVQGLLRKVQGETVLPIDWNEKEKILPQVYFLKANEEELKVLTGFADVERGARQLAQWGVKEVIITLGSKGSVIYAEEKFYQVPAYQPPQLVDATGCGDTYMAGYLCKRIQGEGIQAAGEFAAAMATAKLAVSGPFKGGEEEIFTL
ncbi:MAG TPA: PfkB family carbohydrate kinase [Flavisolibacter sp.]|nr:PfkB family carbohydrate kinase [Flavisolibacter sp.]